ncbi:MAG: DUF58 domain-containing protein [Phycisphaerales bacterium]|nr:DUF58 domain-containing protein [Planctomycetota bacterium]
MLISATKNAPRTIEELLPPSIAAKLDRLDVFSRRVFAGKLPGERRSKRRGRSVEFDDFREYAAGDDLRHVDWNIYARFDRLIIKLFREEEDLALHLVVDASPSMFAGEQEGRPGQPEVASKAVFAHRLAMALAYVGLVRNNRVSIATVGREVVAGRSWRMTPLRGRLSLHRIGDFLLGSLAEGGGKASELEADVRRAAAGMSGRGLVVLLSDLLVPGAGAKGLAAIAAGEHASLDAYCLQILSPAELDPARAAKLGLSGDLRLTDIETGRGVELTISTPALARYRERLEEFLRESRSACRTRGVAHFLVPTDTPIDRLVVDSLRRGGMMR